MVLKEHGRDQRKRWTAKKFIMDARHAAAREIAANSQGKFGAGLASEGYAGGYRDALDDVLLVLNRVMPRRRGYWLGE